MTPSSLDPVSRLSARATFQDLEGGVVLMRMTGPLCLDAIAEFGRRLIVRSGSYAMGWIFDFRPAVLMANDLELDQFAKTPHPDGLRRPGGFVVSSEYESVFQGQALRMAMRGFDRRCFDSVERAHQWVLWAARP